MNISEGFRNYVNTVKQAALPVVLELKKRRNDPDFFQKVAQVAFASIQVLILSSQKAAHLARFSFALATANMHDFYRFVQYPQKLFFPVNVQSIDERVVYTDVFSFISNDFPNLDANELGRIIRICLEKQLKQMADSGDAYRDIKQFQEVLQGHLQAYTPTKEVLEEPVQDDEVDQRLAAYDFLENIDLSGLNDFIERQRGQVSNWFRPVSFLDRIISINWAVVDFGCFSLYLQGWKLLNTAKLAERIGQCSAFQWVKNTQLGTFVVGTVFTGFAFQLVEAARKLRNEALTPQDRRKARWDVITSAAECVLFGAIFLNQIGKTTTNAIYIHYFAIASKSLGLMSIVTRPERVFFQKAVRVI